MTQVTGPPGPAAQAAPPPVVAARAEAPFVVRVAGLPAGTLAGLSSPPLLAAVRAVLDTERHLAAEGRALADELAAAVGTAGDLKPRLVGLRRSLYRGRAPRPGEWSPAVRAALPPAVARRIAAWTDLRPERDRQEARLATVLAAETARTERLLLAAAALPAFRHGLAQSSPTLSAELDKHLPLEHARPARRLLVRLARYVSRAAAKTSPDTTFALIGAGDWSDAAGPLLRLGRLPAPRGLIETHGTLLDELTGALLADPGLRPRLPLRANPSATASGGRLTVVGRRPAEDIATLAATPAVLRCLAALAAGPLLPAQLHAALAGAGTPGPGVAVYVERLTEVGVLERHLPVDDQHPDPYGELARWLRAGGEPGWSDLAGACAVLSGLLTAPTALDDTAGHTARLRDIGAAVTALRDRAGLPGDPAGRSAVPHEYAVFTRPVATAARPAWRRPLADLDAVRRWMAPHDPSLPLRVALAAWAAERLADGGPVPFPVFHRALLADVSREGRDRLAAELRTLLTRHTTPAEWRLPALRDLAAVREGALRPLSGTPDADGVLRVPPQRLTAVADGFPPYARAAASVAWYVQPAGSQLVLNAAMSGHGRGRGRALHLIAAAGGSVSAAAAGAAPRPGEPVAADSSGRFGHSLNLRLPGGGRELDYPFTVPPPGARARVALGDLDVVPDPATGLLRVRHRTTGEHVLPVHGGMVVESGLPPGLRLLVHGFGAGPSWLLRPGDLLAPVPAAGVVHAPRVEVGRVVLRRAAWSVPAALVPRRAAGEDPAPRLLRLHRWLAEHALPGRCFVRAATGAVGPAAEGPKARKPLYVDFAAPWTTAVFERLAAAATGHLVFTEALPDIGPPFPPHGPTGTGPAPYGGPSHPADRLVEVVVETTAELP